MSAKHIVVSLILGTDTLDPAKIQNNSQDTQNQRGNVPGSDNEAKRGNLISSWFGGELKSLQQLP